MKNENVNYIALVVLAGLLVFVIGFAWSKFSSPKRNPNLDGGSSEVLPASDASRASATFQTFDIYFVDNSDGQVEADGCSLELVGVERGPYLTTNVLERAVVSQTNTVDEFLSNDTQYNALYESDLTFLASRVSGDTAAVELRGWLRLEDGCQQTRAIAQLEETINQIANTDEAKLILNQQPIEAGLRFEPVD